MWRNNLKTWLVISVFLAGMVGTAAGRIITVDDDGPADFNNIQAAINVAEGGDVVVVADGVYTGTGNKNLDFKGNEIIVQSENGPEYCIIDCENSGRGFSFHSSEGPNSVLDGFTVINGYVSNGGGICCNNSSPTITDCFIRSNFAANDRRGGGGGLYFKKSRSKITRCVIADNRAKKYGGAIYSTQSGVIIRQSVITTNSSRAGGGLYSVHGGSNINGCTITYNSCKYSGGGLFFFDGTSKVDNTILWGNRGGNNHQIYRAPYATSLRVSYCDVEGGYKGEENMNLDPMFEDPSNKNHHLLPSSPCIDTGDPNYPYDPNETDLDGNPRIQDGDNDGNCVVDMGAYEFLPPVEVPTKFTPQALNPGSKGKWVKAHFVLPEGFTVEDVDTDSPAKIVEPFYLESEYMNVFINEEDLVEIEAAFSRADFCGNGPIEGTIKVIGVLTTGQYFYGTDTIKIINNSLEYLAVLASHWLEGGCGAPDWCSGFDLDQDSVVNFVDFALFDGCCIEFTGQ